MDEYIDFITLLLNSTIKIIKSKLNTKSEKFTDLEKSRLKSSISLFLKDVNEFTNLVTTSNLLMTLRTQFNKDSKKCDEYIFYMEDILTQLDYFNNNVFSDEGESYNLDTIESFDQIINLYKKTMAKLKPLLIKCSKPKETKKGSYEYNTKKTMIGGNEYISGYKAEFALMKSKAILKNLEFSDEKTIKEILADFIPMELRKNLKKNPLKVIIKLFNIDSIFQEKLQELENVDINNYFNKQLSKYTNDLERESVIGGYQLVNMQSVERLNEVDYICIEFLLRKTIHNLNNMNKDELLLQVDKFKNTSVENFHYRAEIRNKLAKLESEINSITIEEPIVIANYSNDIELLQGLIKILEQVSPRIRDIEDKYLLASAKTEELIKTWELLIGPGLDTCIMHIYRVLDAVISCDIIALLMKKYNLDPTEILETKKNIETSVNISSLSYYKDEVLWDNIEKIIIESLN